MKPSVAFVGAGPTTIYTLHALLETAPGPFSLTIFEEQASAGRGTPYRPGWNDPAMLSNIASIEIPPLVDSLVDWLRDQPGDRLTELGVDPTNIGERTFYPRLALGAFFHAQFEALLDQARALGADVQVKTRCRVLDAQSTAQGITLKIRHRSNQSLKQTFNHVVLATGHQWPEQPEVRPGYFLSPWPASALATIAPCHVGIRGTSLTAIDATVALAVAHGEFVEREDGTMAYMPAPNTDSFRITMMSRKGLLPEADFYGPLPYEPLAIFTPEAADALIGAPDGALLDQAFSLFRQELLTADPGYAAKLHVADLSIEEFHDRYFEDRANADPFVWAEANLREAQRNYEAKYTVPWRYAILRMHEVMARLIPYLEQDDFKRFSRYFKPIFVDDYATVPHKSIKRMIALHKAGKLEIVAIGDEYRIDSHRPEGGATVTAGENTFSFPVFIEATGQRALQSRDFPFKSLLRQGIVRDVDPSAQGGSSRGIVIDDEFHPVADDIPVDQLFCLSLPFILGRHPFIQGITSSHEMGQVVGQQLAKAIDRDLERSSKTNLASAT